MSATNIGGSGCGCLLLILLAFVLDREGRQILALVVLIGVLLWSATAIVKAIAKRRKSTSEVQNNDQ